MIYGGSMSGMARCYGLMDPAVQNPLPWRGDADVGWPSIGTRCRSGLFFQSDFGQWTSIEWIDSWWIALPLSGRFQSSSIEIRCSVNVAKSISIVRSWYCFSATIWFSGFCTRCHDLMHSPARRCCQGDSRIGGSPQRTWTWLTPIGLGASGYYFIPKVLGRYHWV